MEMDVPEQWDGHTLVELNIRAKYKINVIGLKRDNELDINPSAERPLSKDDVLVVIGDNDMLSKFKTKLK